MHIKHIHETIECLAEYGKELVKAGTGSEEVNLEATSKIIDMIKDLSEAEYYARISKAMEEAEKEDEEEAKRIMREMKEEYDDEEGERRFYDNYRYKRTGRYAPKGRGTYVGRRGYTEPMYHMPLDMYHNYSAEELRDMDRENMNRLYYTDTGMSGNSGNVGGGSSSRGYQEGYSDGNRRGYEEGMNEGTRRGYEDGMRDGERKGRNSQSSSRYDRARRGYEEAKAKHGSNSAEDKQIRMKEAEKTADVFLDALIEMVEDETPEVKSMIKTKGISKLQKIS